MCSELQWIQGCWVMLACLLLVVAYVGGTILDVLNKIAAAQKGRSNE